MEPGEFIQITTTTASLEEAQMITRALLEKRLAAATCIESGVSSSYWWKGEIREAAEWRCTIKTRREHYERVEAEIVQLHSYETPAIQAFALTAGSARYLKWMGVEASGRESASPGQ